MEKHSEDLQGNELVSHLSSLNQDHEERIRLVTKYGEPHKILDKGWLRLYDVFGSDKRFTDIARNSYKGGTKKVHEDADLLRMLVRNWHTSPIEFGEIIIQLRCPMYIGEQILRHRTASINKESGRYSEMKDEMYIPDRFRKQSKSNKQGSEGDFTYGENLDFGVDTHDLFNAVRRKYEDFLEQGMAREQARNILPAAQYTTFFWKIDCHNLMHFLRLRVDAHAQKEVRLYADRIFEIFKDWMPVLAQAFEDYRLNALTFSASEQKMVLGILSGMSLSEVVKANPWKLTRRELREFKQKMGKIYT